jgi:hypothetical protein
MKDADLKESLFKHYWAQGCFVQPEVDIHYQEAIDGSPKAVTDVDVFALRPHPDLYFERIVGDCKSQKNMSPVNRVLWVRGLMEFLGAKTGCVLMGQGTRIEGDHKLTANSLGITLLNQNDFRVYDRCMIYPGGSERIIMSTTDIIVLKSLPVRFPRLSRLTLYIYRDAWREEGPSKLIRHCLAAMRATRGEFDPGRFEHVALVCDAAAVFSIGVAEIAGRIFQQYLHPEDKALLSDSLKVMLWGGRDAYNYYTRLHKKLVDLHNGAGGDEQDTLELPEWNLFVQLIRNILEYPTAAFRMPQLLRRMACDILRNSLILDDVTIADIVSLKIAMLTLSYFIKASDIPVQFDKFLVDHLVGIQSRLAVLASKPSVRSEQLTLPVEDKREHGGTG